MNKYIQHAKAISSFTHILHHHLQYIYIYIYIHTVTALFSSYLLVLFASFTVLPDDYFDSLIVSLISLKVSSTMGMITSWPATKWPPRNRWYRLLQRFCKGHRCFKDAIVWRLKVDIKNQQGPRCANFFLKNMVNWCTFKTCRNHLAPFGQEDDLWIHVDAAYAGAAWSLERFQEDAWLGVTACMTHHDWYFLVMSCFEMTKLGYIYICRGYHTYLWDPL